MGCPVYYQQRLYRENELIFLVNSSFHRSVPVFKFLNHVASLRPMISEPDIFTSSFLDRRLHFLILTSDLKQTTPP